jgi:uncharacterized protein YndB with AHSA1/START domain
MVAGRRTPGGRSHARIFLISGARHFTRLIGAIHSLNRGVQDAAARAREAGKGTKLRMLGKVLAGAALAQAMSTSALANGFATAAAGPLPAPSKNLRSRVGLAKPRPSLWGESSIHGEIGMPKTIRILRVLATGPEKVYRAFLEADALAKWLPPNGFACTVHHLEPKVGGAFKMSFRNFTTGKSHTFGGDYVELVPGERLRYTEKFDDPNLPGEMQVTVTLKKVSVGTELDIVQGVPDAIPPEACYLGWQESLQNLARLVEPEINQ